MVNIIFEIDKLAIAYIIQLRKIRDYGVKRTKWRNLFKGTLNEEDEYLIRNIETSLESEYAASRKIMETVEEKWLEHGRNIINWLRELTKVEFRQPSVRVCVVPYNAGQTPFKDIPLIIVGKIRGGWDYPETIAHELAHVLLNQNFDFDDEIEHPYIQLIEEEIAVRLGARSEYFDYEIPEFARWVHKAKEEEQAWREYLEHLDDYKDISEFIRTRTKHTS